MLLSDHQSSPNGNKCSPLTECLQPPLGISQHCRRNKLSPMSELKSLTQVPLVIISNL